MKKYIIPTLFTTFCIGLCSCAALQLANKNNSRLTEETSNITPQPLPSNTTIPESNSRSDSDPTVSPDYEKEDTLSDVNTADEKENPKSTASEAVYEFTETSEIVYAVANVNFRSSYSLKADNILAVIPKGEAITRIGFHPEWNKTIYKDETGYIKTEYLSSIKPVMEESASPTPTVTPKPSAASIPSASESFVSDLAIASTLDQLICVIGNGGSDSTLSFHTKNKEGKWIQQFSVDADVGSKGITYDKKEGDSKTPAGLFTFGIAFGIKADPGSLLPYRQITEYDYWIDDVHSPYYNTWVNSQEIPGTYKSEHLIDHAPQYNYAIHINYNPDNTPGLGSAIFLHGYNGTGKTTGCIAIPETYVKNFITSITASTKILIVPSNEDLSNY